MYHDYDEFADVIDEHDGIYLTTMEVLREAHQAKKLGVHIRQAIKSELASRGIGTLPEELPTYQHQEVRLYRLGSLTANIISAVQHPSEAGDTTLRQVAGEDANEVLEAIRALVCP